jgi:hypothetical protein
LLAYFLGRQPPHTAQNAHVGYLTQKINELTYAHV